MEMTKKQSKKEIWMKILEYSLPALIAIGIFVLAMICKGVYPFGKNSLSYIDYNEGLVPSYTGLWDWLHGKGSFFVSFDLGAGGSLFSSFVTNSFLSPISWLIGMFPREHVMYGIAFLLIVKFALMATTSYVCFKKFFPRISSWILLMFSLLWTFSGWTVIHFTNVGWLDLMILLPLLIMSAKALVEKGKIFWFVITLSYMLILSYYISYMVLVGVVIIATVYIFTLVEKENRMKVASSLFYAIFISLLISMVTFIPSCVTSLQAHRFAGDVGVEKKELISNFFSKLAVVIMYALPIVLFVRLMCKYKQNKRPVLFFMLSFVICSAGIIFEPINKMWHTGSYYCFPIRYAFVLVMLLIFASLYYLDKYIVNPDAKTLEIENAKSLEKSKKKKWFDPVKSLLPVFLGFSVFGVVWICYTGVSTSLLRPANFTRFFPYLFMFAMSYGAFELLLRVKTTKLDFGKIKGGILIFVLVLVQIVGTMIGYVGMPYAEMGQNTARVENAFKIDTSKLENGYKIKDRERLYNHNFAYFTQYPTLSSWIHISSEQQYQAYHKLGYNTSSTVLFSSGGTIMTDALLGNKYVLSREELDPEFYEKIDEFDYFDESEEKNAKVGLYELQLDVKKAFTTSVDLGKLLSEAKDSVEVQNLIYKALFAQDDNIMTKANFMVKEEDDKFVVTVYANQNKYLYALSSGKSLVVKHSGKELNFENGFNDIGYNVSDEIVLEVYKEDNKYNLKEMTSKCVSDQLCFAEFDMATFKNVYENNFVTDDVSLEVKDDKLVLSVQNDLSNKYLFVPFINLKNMMAVNNEKGVDVENSLVNFMQVELQNGENKIQITYKQQLLKPCLIITIVAILLFVLFSVLNHFFALSNKKFVWWVGTIGACLILAVVGYMVYFKPFIETFIILFS